MIHLALTSGSDFGPKIGFDFAPKFGPSFKAQIQGVWGQIWWWKFVPGEVFGYWQWLSYLQHVSFQRGKRPVFINLDETSIGLHLSPNPGLVCKHTAKLGLCQERARKRGAVTLCAAITHAAEIQPYLPQLVLGARAILSRSFLRAAQDRVSPRLLLKAYRSGWMTQTSFCDFVDYIADALDLFDSVQGILVLDCCPAHLSDQFLQTLSNRNLLAVFVPTATTGHLQPLDVGAFRPLKSFLRRRACQKMADSGHFDKLDWIESVSDGATRLLTQKNWASVFARCGFWRTRACTTKGTLADIAKRYEEVEPVGKPTEETIFSLLPKGCKLPYADLVP